MIDKIECIKLVHNQFPPYEDILSHAWALNAYPDYVLILIIRIYI